MWTSIFKILLFFFLASSLQAQTFTWTADIAPLIYKNCSSCHHSGGIGLFELMTYDDVVDYAPLIHEAIEHRYMPPWPADPMYRHFVGETYLSQEEINLVHTWIDTGMLFGDPSDAPAAPEFLESGSLLEQIDLTIEIEPYALQSNSDEYRWFVIETNFEESKYISKLEVFAGLKNVVHHADLFLDLTGNSKAFDVLDPLPGFNSSTGTPTNNRYISAWQPGAGPASYPDNWGIEIPSGADLVIEIHYGPEGIGQVDSTRMNIQFLDIDTAPIRAVKAAWLLNDSAPVLVDGPLVIPANEIVTFHQESAPLTQDLSLISICPHMHFLGKSYEVWFETQDGEVIPLINIPHWDFHWQKYYTFQQIQKVPKGSILKSVGVYDNTVNNHDNPNNPPITISKGLTTEDEMFLCYFIYANYEEGDENIILDPNLITTPTTEISSSAEIDVFPNPVQNQLFVNIKTKTILGYSILNTEGIVVQKGKISPNQTTFDIHVEHLPNGLYFMEINGKEVKNSTSFIKIE